MAFDPLNLLKPRDDVPAPSAPLAGTKSQRLQRVQIGLFGLATMIMLVGLADVVIQRAAETEANVVSEAVSSILPDEPPAPRDPLAEAGVVPEVSDGPAGSDTTSPPPPQTTDVAPPQSRAGN